MFGYVYTENKEKKKQCLGYVDTYLCRCGGKQENCTYKDIKKGWRISYKKNGFNVSSCCYVEILRLKKSVGINLDIKWLQVIPVEKINIKELLVIKIKDVIKSKLSLNDYSERKAVLSGYSKYATYKKLKWEIDRSGYYLIKEFIAKFLKSRRQFKKIKKYIKIYYLGSCGYIPYEERKKLKELL